VKKRTISGAILLMLAWQISALAQGLLPDASGRWTASGNANMIKPAQLESVAANQADVLREYGVTSAEQRNYSQGQQTASVTLYRMTDPSAAYGAFTFLRDSQMGDLDLGDSVAYAAGDTNKAIFVAGNLLAMVASAGQRPPDGSLSELAAVLLPHADHRPYPSISGYLPHSSVAAGTQKFPLRPGGATVALPARLSLVPESERYLLGPRAVQAVLGDSFPATNDDWMGFHFSAEAIAAQYRPAGRAPGQDVTLLLTLYPTQQIANSQFTALGKWMALNVDPSQAGGRKVVYGSRSSALVALVFGADSQDVANRLISQIQYHTAVTWNEPSQSFTDPSFPVMMIGVFEGTGLLMLLALAVGFGFGGFRLLMKIILPGRVFDRDSDVEILQLGLTTKPIDSRDFFKSQRA
jgi:hypothetical protein